MRLACNILASLSFAALSACGGEPKIKEGQLYEHEYWELSLAECPKVETGLSREEMVKRRQCSIAFFEKNKGLLRRDQVSDVKWTIDDQRKYLKRDLERLQSKPAPKQEN